jgi:hypothetical protein
MPLRYLLAAAIVFAGSSGTAWALPMNNFTLPSDNSQSQTKDSSDGLFNHSVPDRWTNKSEDRGDDHSNDLGKFHFSVSGSSEYQVPRSSYGDAHTPRSEFYQPTPATSPDPSLEH